ncbi:alpha-2-macroglobulin family protein [Armatimonas sp.]|uniref:alpha-2-macroglobulin family protein n=1 Tax=Armatimonas sp. TaxID=1872638 RepID=UPI00286CCFBE|nr:alpha-2-macroglobulin family protein [Armatimonas sp.]
MTKQRKYGALLGVLALAGVAGATYLRGGEVVSAAEAGEDVEGLRFRLSAGKLTGGESPAERLPITPAQKLSDADADKILARVKAIATQPDDEKDFALREASLPAPRAGQTITAEFPPKPTQATAPVVESGTLTLRRFQPEGEVPLADRVSLTFSQPMVAVTGQEDAAARVPVTLSPEVPGKWRWLGTQTLIFDAGSGKRLPMATEFSVSLPAGTKSVTGGVLERAQNFTFKTPAVRLLSYGPYNGSVGQRRDPLIWLSFDQKIDPDAVLKTVRVLAGDKPVSVQRASQSELEKAVGKSETPEPWLALKPVGMLPGDTQITVQVGPGTPSAEGTRVTESAQSFWFRTYGPLKLIEQSPKRDQSVPPSAGWSLRFTNPLDVEVFDPAWVTVSPATPGLQITTSGEYLQLYGLKKARTTYKVTVSPKLKDSYGQNLEGMEPAVFTVGAAEQQLSGPSQILLVPDPAAAPRTVFSSVNVPSVKVKLYSVSSADWDAWRTWQSNWEERRKGATPPGKLIKEQDVALTGADDTLHENDLALPKNGSTLIWWEANGWKKRNQYDEPPRGAAWVQPTKIGLTAFADGDDLYALATELTTGKPISGAEVSMVGSGQSAKTGKDGLVKLALMDKPGTMLVAKRGNESAFLPSRFWRWDESSWRKQGRGTQSLWFVWDDRQLYKPGEKVHVKGWVRQLPGSKLAALTLPASAPLTWQLKDSRGNEVSKGQAKLNAWGGFDVAFELPKTINLGQTSLMFVGAGGAMNHSFNVQEFRRPEFEVSAKSESAGPHVIADPKGADLSAKAAYYAGGPLPGAQTTWTVNASPSSYTPPGRSEFTFGKWTPWWSYGGGFEDGISFRGGRGGFGRGVRQANLTQNFSGVTDPMGVHRLHLDFDGVKPAQPYSVSAQAVIQDVNRQALATSTSLLIHPSARYVGLRSKTTFVAQGKPLVLEALACDIDGKAEPGQEIQLRAARQEYEWSKGRYQLVEKDIREWTVRSSKEAVETQLGAPAGGQWKIKATVRDSKERPNESELTLWVAGGKPSPRRDLAQEQVTLIPSAKEYTPGQTAEILVQAPFFPAEGVLTLRRNGVIQTERFNVNGPTHTVKIPIQEAYLPNIHAHIELVGAAARTDDDGKALTKLAKRPAFASGELDLSISTASKKLTVVASPKAAALAPGSETEVYVSVKDSNGKPIVGGEVAVAVVDESVHALAGWSMGDLVAAFHPRRGSGVSDWHLRSYVKLEDPLKVTNASGVEVAKNGMMLGGRRSGAPGGGGGFGGGMMADGLAMESKTAPSSAPMSGMVAKPMKTRTLADEKPGAPEAPEPAIAVRTNFDPLAHFSPSVVTDSDGTARVSVKLPDNLTRYRIVAVAVAGADKGGSGEASLTARLPLMARPSAPRFLNVGDKFELPVVLQNQTDAPMTVDVAVRATNATLTDGRGRRVQIPANDRVEVRFPTESAKPGTARFQFAAVAPSAPTSGGTFADSAEVSLPVWTPATTEAFATYGVVDKGAIVQPVRAPSDANPAFGELEITTSSTALQELTDAYIYLASYPYGCAEQISSRVLTTAALKDVLSAFKATGMPKESELNAAMARDLARLGELQNPDGSFGFWARNERPWPYLGVHVAHALVRAKQKGFAVPDQTYKRSLAYAKAIATKFEEFYSPRCRRMITAYALYVRHLAGDSDKVKAKALLASAPLDEHGPETIGWLLNVLAGDPDLANVRRWLDNKATETAGAAHYTFSYSDGAYLVLSSDRRADGIVLDALIADQPQSDLIPKLVRGLLDGRKRGAWGNTQENAFILLALDRYFRKFEGVTPDFVARLWLGEKFAGEGTFKGRTTDRIATKIPMATLTEKPGMQPLTIDKQGAGRLYYRIGMRYAPKSLQLPAADYGFSVNRVYEAIDNPSDVKRDADGTWVVKAGAKVRVKVTMVATTRRYHVALTDPMPAGFEALNPELRGTEISANTASPQIAGRGGFGRFPYYWSWWHWYEHQNLRDERAEAFSSYLWEGAYEYSYICRATTPGTFIAPPAKAEEMYAPETFGRSASDRVRVE